jgi:hypothetical protein
VSADALADIKDRLHNWARWSRHDCLPDLHAKLSSLWSQWIPRQAWDCGWGDMGAPEERAKSIREQDAELIDYSIRRLNMLHRNMIKKHYIDQDLLNVGGLHTKHGRELLGERMRQLDEACRALEDLMR